MEAISAGITVMVGVVGDVFSLITGNPVLAAFVGCSLLVAGLGLFSSAKNTAK